MVNIMRNKTNEILTVYLRKRLGFIYFKHGSIIWWFLSSGIPNWRSIFTIGKERKVASISRKLLKDDTRLKLSINERMC